MNKQKYSDILQRRVDAISEDYIFKKMEGEFQPEMFWAIPKTSIIELNRLSRLEIKNE